jgi:AcrR family transcriptional regulator
VVTAAGADLVDEVGFDQLSMGLLAERLGVRTPSLYKHVAGQSDLAHAIGVLAMTELADAIGGAIQGRSGPDALLAGAHAMRDFVRDHPGRYAAGNAAQLTGDGDPLLPASGRVMATWLAMLHGYHLDPDHELHALRMLRSMLHGFAVLESAGSFQVDSPVDDSFAWMVDFVDHSLQSLRAPGPQRTATTAAP